MLPAWFGLVRTARPFCCFLRALLLSALSLAVDFSPQQPKSFGWGRSHVPLTLFSFPGHTRAGTRWVLLDTGTRVTAPPQLRKSKATRRGWALGVMLYPPHRVLGEAVLPFPPALAEVTLGIGCGRRVILRSYQEEEAGERARRGLRRR